MLGFTKFKINRLVNRRELYSNFSYNKWNQLDTGSKWKCLQQLENHFAAEQGRPAVKVLQISSKEVRGDYGGYDPDKNVIYINRDLVEYGTLVGPVDINHPTQLDANMQLFDTIAHEGYHAYQGYAIKHPGFHKDMKQVKVLFPETVFRGACDGLLLWSFHSHISMHHALEVAPDTHHLF